MRNSVALAIALFLYADPVAAAEDPCPVPGPLAATVCALRHASGEGRDLRPEAFFFESSKVLFLPQVLQNGGHAPSASQERLALEVEFNETIFPYQNRASALDRHLGGVTWAAGLTPMYRVRIWREFSAPVRTPSFMPKGTLQFNYVGPRKAGRQWGDRADGSRGYVPLTSLMLTLYPL